MRVRVVGGGRAGGSLAIALAGAGWDVDGPLGRGGDLAGSAAGVDVLVLAVPDAAIAEVAALVVPVPTTTVVHLAGSLGLDVLAPHERRAAVHPLVALPSPGVGAGRLVDRAWFALARGGDPRGAAIVDALGGRSFVVADDDRAAYHAAAAIASNHVVAVLDQAAAVAPASVPFEAYLALVRATIDNVAALGPERALTGPASRGDSETIERHLEALDPEERELYLVLATRCRQIAVRRGDP